MFQGVIIKSFSVPASANNPSGLAYDGKDLWMVDNSADDLFQVSTDGVHRQTFNIRNGVPNGLTFDGKHFAYCDFSNGNIYKIKPDGTELQVVASGLTQPSGIEFFEGQYYVANNLQTINIYSKDFKLIRTYNSTGISRDMACDGRFIYGGNPTSDDIVVFDAVLGVKIKTINFSPLNPNGMAYDGKTFWVMSNQTDQIYQMY